MLRVLISIVIKLITSTRNYIHLRTKLKRDDHPKYEKRRLNFTTNIEEALQYSKVLFIFGTPADEDGSADLKYVLTVARDSRKHLNDHMLVVTENAVPV
jgi:UDP-glucose 6-dehydrogenase